MRRRLGLITAAGAGLTVLLAGCGNDEQAAPASAPSSDASQPAPASSSAASDGATEAWVNDFCGAVVNLTDLQNMQMPNVQPGDFAASKTALSDLLGTFETSVGATLDGLQNLGPAPEPAGDQAKQTMLDVFTPVKESVSDAKAKIDSATEQNPQPMQEALGGLQSLGTTMTEAKNPLAGIQASPELNAAGQKAPNCQKLK